MKQLVFLLLFLQWISANGQATKMTPIFNGSNLDGWTKFLKLQGEDKDPQKVFTVENGAIHVTGQDFGYIATKKSYKNFHLSLEFKWGEKKFPPRENQKRDAGICFNVDLEIGRASCRERG